MAESSVALRNQSLQLSADAITKRGQGMQMMGGMNAFMSLNNAVWQRSINKRNAKITEMNARRIEATRSFVLAGMRKQMSETEKKQRRNMKELVAKRMVQNAGTADFRKARAVQMENMVQLHRIAAENKVRETDFDFRNRAYDTRLKGANQRIAGARKTSANLMQTGQHLGMALDTSYKDSAASMLSMQQEVEPLVEDANPLGIENPLPLSK